MENILVMLGYIEIIVLFWSVFIGIALGLISWRTDGYKILNDFERMVIDHKFPFNVLTFLLIILILPLSIPFSIIHLWRK